MSVLLYISEVPRPDWLRLYFVEWFPSKHLSQFPVHSLLDEKHFIKAIPAASFEREICEWCACCRRVLHVCDFVPRSNSVLLFSLTLSTGSPC